MELGLYTFGEVAPDPATRHAISPQQRMRDLLEEAELADQVGLFGQDLEDYDELFAEKLELLLKLREDERVTWPGSRTGPRSRTSASTRGRCRSGCRC